MTTMVRSSRAAGADAPLAQERARDGNAAIRRGVVLLLGAGAIIVAIAPLGPLDYFWIPVFTGGIFALAALASGRGSPLMGAGLTVLGWGAAMAITAYFGFTGDYAFSTGMIGLGALAAYALGRYGWPVTALSVGFSIVFIALGVFIHGQFGLWVTPYACMLTGLYGVAELGHAVRARGASRAVRATAR